MTSDRNIRMEGLPVEDLRTANIQVIGVGAVGGYVAQFLAQMDCLSVTLFDPDTVGVENVGNQGFWPRTIGATKVAARMLMYEPLIEDGVFTPVDAKWTWDDGDQPDLVFLCVDSLDTRGKIVTRLQRQGFQGWVIDGRMGGLTSTVYALQPASPAMFERYQETLDASTVATNRCAELSTLHAATVTASIMVTAAMASFTLIPPNFRVMTLLDTMQMEVE